MKMKIILLGPPGVGKGTQANNLSKKFNLPKISTGDILRDAAKQETELGKKAKECMEKGILVPDEVVIGIIKELLKKEEYNNGFFLDGFPRTISQAKALVNVTDIDTVLNLKASDESIIKRLSTRRVCENCQTGFNIISLKPKQEGICDKCGGNLILRDDDKPETIKKRLEIYNNQTKPLIEYYEEKGILKNINAEPSIKEVFEEAVKVLSNT